MGKRKLKTRNKHTHDPKIQHALKEGLAGDFEVFKKLIEKAVKSPPLSKGVSNQG